MKIFKLLSCDLDESFENLKRFHQDFASDFRTKTCSVEQYSLQYLQGIFLEQGRGNMVKYAKKVPDTDNQALQHFISNSPWDEEPVTWSAVYQKMLFSKLKANWLWKCY